MPDRPDLLALRDRPLAAPVARAAARRAGYRDHPVDLDDPRGADPLVELRDLGIAGANAYWTGVPPYGARVPGSVPGLWLRAPLAEALARVDARLRGHGLHLWVFDAWRPIAVQNHFHDHWMPARLRALHPEWDDARVAAETERYWARGAPGGVVDPRSPPPHATGAAVDLTIRRADGAELFMGTIFDDVSEASNTAAFEPEPEGLAISHREARANRRLLHWAMDAEGFANNPTEWWHFSRGDQMWARITGTAAAHYSVASPPG